MSDIGIRIDGLLLLAVLGVATVSYFAVALVVGAGVLTRRFKSSGVRRVAAIAALLTLVSGGALIATFSWLDTSFVASGVDWADWLSVPAGLACIAGWIVVARARTSTR